MSPPPERRAMKTKCKSARVCFYGGTTVLLLVLFTIRLIYACIPTLGDGPPENQQRQQQELVFTPISEAIPEISPRSRSHPVAASTAESFSAQHTTALWCPLYTRIASPLLQSQSRALPSLLAVTKYAASTLNTQSHTHLECPFKVRSNPNPSKFHNFTVLSLLVVAKLLTSGEIKHFNTYSSGCALNLCNGSKCAVVFASFCNRHT